MSGPEVLLMISSPEVDHFGVFRGPKGFKAQVRIREAV